MKTLDHGYLNVHNQSKIRTIRMAKRKTIIISLGVFLLAASVLIFFPSEQRLKIYDKNFYVLDAEYNYVNVLSGERFKQKLVFFLSKLGVPQKILATLQRAPREAGVFSSLASSHDIFRVYFRWPHPFDDLTNFYAELIDEHGKTLPLLKDSRSTHPERNEKSLTWAAEREALNPNSIYTIRIKSAATNVFPVADIRIGPLNNPRKQ